MSILGEYEDKIAGRLKTATIGATEAFATVEGVSGGYRPVLREAIRRERMPAAYVAFVEDPTAPEVRAEVRGPKFAVLIAARSLRVESDPRHGDLSVRGAFEIIDVTQARLDGYLIGDGQRVLSLRVKFLEADERVAVYELLYRVWPETGEEMIPLFNGEAIAGDDSRMRVEVGGVELEHAEFSYPGLAGVYRQVLGVRPRPIVWRGQVRAADGDALDAIESQLEAQIVAQTAGELTDGTSRQFGNCVLDRYVRLGDRRHEAEAVVQNAELHFQQLNPAT